MDHLSDPAGTESWSMQIKHNSRKMQVRMADQAMYHQGNQSVFVGGRLWTLLPPPALFRKGEDGRKKKREVLHLFRCYTHTPGRSRVNPERQEEEKADTRRADGQKQRKGGGGNRRTSGTNLHGETDLTKTAHTPKPHDTLRRGTRGKLGTKWGTSWWQTRKPKQLVKQQDSAPKPRVRTLCHSRPVFKSCPNWHKTAFKFQRIRCTICFTSPDTKETTPVGKGHACCLLSHMSCWTSKTQAAVAKTEFLVVPQGFTLWRMQFSKDLKGLPEQRDFSRKRQKTARPTVALYLNELPS